MFIVVEGCDGSGKSSVVSKLVEKCKDLKSSVFQMKQPSNPENIRNIKNSEHWLEQAFWFMRDRETIKQEIETLSKRSIVIIDRYYHSTICYQLLNNGISLLDGLKIHEKIIVEPDISIILTCSEEEQVRRLKKRKNIEELEKFEDFEFQKKVRRNYLCFRGFPNHHFVDTTNISEDEKVSQCFHLIKEKFQKIS